MNLHIKKANFREFAPLQAMLKLCVRKRFTKEKDEFGNLIRTPSCDAVRVVMSLPISKETVHRALNLEALA